MTLLRPLWQLFMSMENCLSQDPTSITVLLPLHRALTELFFITEARAIVSDTHRPYLAIKTTKLTIKYCVGVGGWRCDKVTVLLFV